MLQHLSKMIEDSSLGAPVNLLASDIDSVPEYDYSFLAATQPI